VFASSRLKLESQNSSLTMPSSRIVRPVSKLCSNSCKEPQTQRHRSPILGHRMRRRRTETVSPKRKLIASKAIFSLLTALAACFSGLSLIAAPALKQSHTDTPPPALTADFPMAMVEPITSAPIYASARSTPTIVDRLSYVPNRMRTVVAALFDVERHPHTSVAAFYKTLPVKPTVAPQNRLLTTSPTSQRLTEHRGTTLIAPLPATPVNVKPAVGLTNVRLTNPIPAQRLVKSELVPAAIDGSGGAMLLPVQKPPLSDEMRRAIAKAEEVRRAQAEAAEARRQKQLARTRRAERVRKTRSKTKKKTISKPKMAPTVAPIGSTWKNSALFAN
jgi:hypothetical protein